MDVNKFFVLSRSYIFLIYALFASSCGTEKVTVEIHNTERRDQYVRVLNETGLKYSIRSDEKIDVYDVDIEKLNNKMSNYYIWERELLENQGVKYYE